MSGHIYIEKSRPLKGSVNLFGAKNAVLAIISSLILTDGTSVLKNVPNSSDVQNMIKLLRHLGAKDDFNETEKILTIDTSDITRYDVSPEIMNKMRASILVMGPLLARFKKASVALPGGCLIGSRPIDFHLKGFEKLGARIKGSQTHQNHHVLTAEMESSQSTHRIVLEYPSVGATENIMMCAALSNKETVIVNAALEPEVLDLISVLKKMGAQIKYGSASIISIKGVNKLTPIEHEIIPDRLEAGSLLLAAAVTGGEIVIPNAKSEHMDAFLEKLKEMGHEISTQNGISLRATKFPKAVSIKTAPYPGFPTDLQAPIMAALALADGVSEIEETVFENRLIHVQELQKMGAQIRTKKNNATIRGVEELYGCDVIATDIRASCALVIAGLAAEGKTKVTGVQHWQRGYDELEHKLAALGANVRLVLEK